MKRAVWYAIRPLIATLAMMWIERISERQMISGGWRARTFV